MRGYRLSLKLFCFCVLQLREDVAEDQEVDLEAETAAGEVVVAALDLVEEVVPVEIVNNFVFHRVLCI